MDYFFNQTSDLIFENDLLNTVGIGLNNSNPQYDLDVRDTIRTSNLISKEITSSNTTSCNIIAEVAEIEEIGASTITSIVGDFGDVRITTHSLSNPKPNDIYPNGFIDFSWLSPDPLSNMVWIDHWADIGGLAGAVAGGALAAFQAGVWYSVPLTSPAGVEGYQEAFNIGGANAGDDGYALAVDVGKEWGIYVAGLEGSRDAGDAGKIAVKTSIETLGTGDSELEASGIGTAAGTTAIIISGNEPLGQGWYSKGLPFGEKIGKLCGVAAGAKVLSMRNSNALYPAIEDAKYGSNTAKWASNAAYYGSNTARWGSNVADWSSNVADWSSNKAYWSSNVADWSSNKAYWSSNTADWSSNTAYWSSNVADWSSNKAYWSSNTADWSSNKAYWSSNTADWASNTSQSASNKAYTDHYWTISPLNVVYTNCNVGIGTSDINTKLDIDGATHIRGENGITYNTQQGLYTNWVTGTTYFINNRGVSGGDFLFQTYNGLGLEKTLMKLDNLGRVGINTTTPAYTLDIDGTANAYAYKEDMNGISTSLITKHALSNALLTQKNRIDNIDTEIDGVKQKNTAQDTTINSHDQRITKLEADVLEAVDEAAEALAEAGQAAVEAAQGIADAAANAAQIAALTTAIAAAQATATAAGTAAASANSAALGASLGAAAAMATATGAAAGAGAAQTTANSATNKAEDAQSTANTALGIAEYSSNALSNYTLSNTHSNIFYGLSNTLSNFTLSNDYFGLSNTLSNHIIDTYTTFSNWATPSITYGSNTALWSSNALINYALTNHTHADKYWTLSNTSAFTNSNVKIEVSSTQGLTIKNSLGNFNLPAEIYFDKTSAGTTQSAAVGMDSNTRDFFVWVNGNDRLNIDNAGTAKFSGQVLAPNSKTKEIGVITTPNAADSNAYGWIMAGSAGCNLGFWYSGRHTYLDGTISSTSNVFMIRRPEHAFGMGATVFGDLVLDTDECLAFIQPGKKEGSASNNVCQFEIGNTGLWYFWDNLQASGTITGSSKNFCIPHPLDEANKVLIHTCIESPKADLHYSGRVKLNKGKASVKINTESCPDSPMDIGTFEALTRNPRVLLQNADGFDRVKGKVVGGTLEIECENTKSTDEVDWLVIAERKDTTFTTSKVADTNGNLITQGKKADWLLEDDKRPSKKKKDKTSSKEEHQQKSQGS